MKKWLALIWVLVTVLSLTACGNSGDTTPGGERDEPTVDTFTVETPYCALACPEQWKEQLRIEKIEGDVYTVEFYGTVAEKGEQHLFDLFFGGSTGDLIGTIDVDGVVHNIYVEAYDLTTDEQWSEAESTALYAMQDAINVIISNLMTLPQFEIAG